MINLIILIRSVKGYHGVACHYLISVRIMFLKINESFILFRYARAKLHLNIDQILHKKYSIQRSRIVIFD